LIFYSAENNSFDHTHIKLKPTKTKTLLTPVASILGISQEKLKQLCTQTSSTNKENKQQISLTSLCSLRLCGSFIPDRFTIKSPFDRLPKKFSKKISKKSEKGLDKKNP